MRIGLMIAASLLALSACDGRDAQDRPAGTETGMATTDTIDARSAQAPSAQEFARMAAMSDMYEIASSNIALQQAQDAQVREFAQMMVTDHTQSSQALRDAVAASGQQLAMPETLDAEHQAQVDVLRGLRGADFDREYMSQQTAAHRRTLDTLKAYAGGGDVAELRQFAQATIPTVQRHLDWLEANYASPGMTGGRPGAPADATPAS